MLNGKHVLLGVTGGIAAYKAVELVSRLRKQGAEVRVILTEHAAQFVTPLLFREISNNKVVSSMWDAEPEFYAEHIKLAEWADILVIAPATANICAKLAHGLADDMLSSTALAVPATKPVLVCPAMNCEMYANPVTRRNLAVLAQLENFRIVEPAEGVLACGTSGRGRLPEPEALTDWIDSVLGIYYGDMRGLRVLVTAAGTREAIDPVRFVGNRSSGKMGYAVARAALSRGASVVLVSGPSKEVPPVCAEFVPVESTKEMLEACLAAYPDTDIVVKAAAVADFRPHEQAEHKIKKENDDRLTLVMDKNPDILYELGQRKEGQFLVGFAAETRDVEAYARKKIAKKHLDLIVANDVTLPGAGFNVDTNVVKLIAADGEMTCLEQMSKADVAEKILDKVLSLRKQSGRV